MSLNEVAEREDSALEVFPPARAHSTTAVAMLYEHAEVYNTAWKLAGQLVQTTMVPKRFFGKQKQGDATAAILFGAELELNPIQSLQRVIPIHGMPSLEARTMVGLLKAKGYKVRTVEQSDESVTVEGVAPDGETYRSTWTIQRAIQAGYVPTPTPDSKRRPDVKEDWVTTSKTWDGKTTVSIVGNMKYITDPQTMLKAKAQAEVCRELAPDVLMGISYTREELESEQQDQFDRMAERGAAPARVSTAAPVTVDEIFAEEVPVPEPAAQPATVAPGNEPYVDAAASAATAFPDAPETPAGDVTEDQGGGAPDPQPSPAAQPEPLHKPHETVQEETGADIAPVKKTPAKKSPAKKSAPRNVSKLRAPLEKRLFALLGDAGIAGDKDRDGRIAVYRAITGRADVESTDDLDDKSVGEVCDQLYRWQTANELDDQIAGILADAAREAEETSAATAADPTTEGTE